MQVTATFRPRRREPETVDLPDGATVEALMQALDQPVDATLAVRGGIPVAEDEALHDGDQVTLMSSFSGG